MKTKHKFIEKPQFSCSDLKQTSKRTVEYSSDEHFPTCFHLTTLLPPYVLEKYWTRYALSEEDVLLQAVDIPPRMYWLAVLLYGMDASNSCVKASFANMDDVLISSKPIAIDKIIKSQNFRFSNTSKLDRHFTHHKPATPKISVSEEEMFNISKLICTTALPPEIVSVKGFFIFKDCLYLPISLEDNAILLNRVVLEDDFRMSGKQQGVLSTPFLVKSQTDDKIYALCEEIVLATLKID